jgi:hypothetical protein
VVLSSDIAQGLGPASRLSVLYNAIPIQMLQTYYFSTQGCFLVFFLASSGFDADVPLAAAAFLALRSKKLAMAQNLVARCSWRYGGGYGRAIRCVIVVVVGVRFAAFTGGLGARVGSSWVPGNILAGDAFLDLTR